MRLQMADEGGGLSAAFKPVVEPAFFRSVEELEQGPRREEAGRGPPVKAKAVVMIGQVGKQLWEVRAEHFGGSGEVAAKVLLNLRVRVAEQVGVCRLQGQVGEVVQLGKDARFVELRDAGHEKEPDGRIIGLEGGIEGRKFVADLRKESGLVQAGRQGSVVFVNQRDDGIVRPGREPVDEGSQSIGRGRYRAVQAFPNHQVKQI